MIYNTVSRWASHHAGTRRIFLENRPRALQRQGCINPTYLSTANTIVIFEVGALVEEDCKDTHCQ